MRKSNKEMEDFSQALREQKRINTALEKAAEGDSCPANDGGTLAFIHGD